MKNFLTAIILLLITAKFELCSSDFIPITILYTSCNKGYFLPYKVHESSFFNEMKLNIGDQFGGYPAIAHYIKKVRKEVSEKKGIFLIVDTGNSLIGCAEANFFNGEVSIDFMNRMGYNAVTVGNLDWNIGKKEIQNLAQKANFTLLGANMFVKDTEKHPEFIKPYTIIEIENLKIGIIGYAQDNIQGWLNAAKVKSWELRPQIPVVKKYVNEMKQKGADLIISVDHADGEIYKQIIENVDGLDILIESASEWATTWGAGFSKDFYLRKHDKIKNTELFHEVDSHFAVGRADVIYDLKNKKIISSEGFRYFMNLNNVERDDEIEKVVNKYAETYFEVVGKKLQEVIGYAEADFTTAWDSQWNTPLGTLITTAIRDYTNTDIGVENLGGIRRYIKKGQIKAKDVEDALPFGNKIVTFKVKGKDLYDVYILKLMAGGAPYPWTYITGLEITRNEDKTLKLITADFKPIDTNKIYSFATNNYIYGSGFINAPVCFDIKVWDIKISEAVIDYIKKNSPISLGNRETGTYYDYKKE